MNLVCLDLEGVLIPEIWIAVSKRTGIDELRLTTRDVSDYDELMERRLSVLERENLSLEDLQHIIDSLQPLPGAEIFLDSLRGKVQTVLLSDTFEQFASPLLRKLAHPTLFCNTLEWDAAGRITGYRLRQRDGKRRAVEGFQAMGMRVLAAGDSYNDLTMIKAADRGLFFRAPPTILDEFPEFRGLEAYSELMGEIDLFLAHSDFRIGEADDS